MPTQDEPGKETDPATGDADGAETISIVDYFDEIDRAAFRRALEHRRSAYPYTHDS
jgi:hypothetical protein